MRTKEILCQPERKLADKMFKPGQWIVRHLTAYHIKQNVVPCSILKSVIARDSTLGRFIIGGENGALYPYQTKTLMLFTY